MTDSVRIDAWLWSVRVYKTRSAATAAVRGGKVRVNDNHVKASYGVRIGDRVRVRIDGFDRILVVKALLQKRVGAPVAATAYEDRSAPLPPRELRRPPAIRERGAGRPTKRERRELDRLLAQDERDLDRIRAELLGEAQPED
ncbi:RNA-binding S4 domain-containing protein [Gulosibacter sp. 10]|uniref:RNA-binding S4 domain-containing protein n=1 Tax=Gulosibacter sp. 10 TaxID=1255570 RepID=UPI00097EB200|nr:RNA-binding S4 domain-containing protein [Gulosibacter sp. 10]SJM65232.1 Ribosome-associated heat shock protein implicated in the recycling of the 50S subunit (S4 paralog) [Gulosibacter sp. 10]